MEKREQLRKEILKRLSPDDLRILKQTVESCDLADFSPLVEASLRDPELGRLLMEYQETLSCEPPAALGISVADSVRSADKFGG